MGWPRVKASPAVTSLWAGVLVLGGLGTDVILHHGAPVLLDTSLHLWVVAHRTLPLVHLAVGITHLGTTLVALPVMLLTAYFLSVGSPRQRLRWALVALAVLITGLLARFQISVLVGRARPPADSWATRAGGYAFPSGHTSAASILAGLTIVTVVQVGSRRMRSGVVVAAALYAFAVGCTRVYLGVHWPTDVIGGWAFGAAWVGGFVWARSLVSKSTGPRSTDRSSAGEETTDSMAA